MPLALAPPREWTTAAELHYPHDRKARALRDGTSTWCVGVERRLQHRAVSEQSSEVEARLA